jgi:hypothetical protein
LKLIRRKSGGEARVADAKAPDANLDSFDVARFARAVHFHHELYLFRSKNGLLYQSKEVTIGRAD